jgi:hypothetical protein
MVKRAFWPAVLLAACGGADKAASQACVPGQQVECACPGGPAGAQACKDDGQGYQPCVCSGGPKEDGGREPADGGRETSEGGEDASDSGGDPRDGTDRESSDEGAGEPRDSGAEPSVLSACTAALVASECSQDEYCDAPDCVSIGTCRPRPSRFASGELDWVCGCNGITYGNATYAHALGVTAPMIGSCTGGAGTTDPLRCATGRPCPLDAVCLPPSSTSCAGSSQGSCWAWSNDSACPSGAQTGYLSCSSAPTCLTECQAITSQAPYRMTTIGCR